MNSALNVYSFLPAIKPQITSKSPPKTKTTTTIIDNNTFPTKQSPKDRTTPKMVDKTEKYKPDRKYKSEGVAMFRFLPQKCPSHADSHFLRKRDYFLAIISGTFPKKVSEKGCFYSAIPRKILITISGKASKCKKRFGERGLKFWLNS
jgi:hypothetical protein